ncbi:hypothetical protein [Pseudomonas sp. C11]|uniref:hypothetical protein n=1 Tax=Pseudomonas sp. C11 TaxID=3075550 RepID=UPI002AFE7C4F|nr:hypothetical protein [Pseudomonas sp. C11]
MAGNKMLEERMRLVTPHTYNALTQLVMALAGAANNLGKKTWFGRDKGVIAYEKLIDKLRHTVTAMTLDGLIQPVTPTPEVIDKIVDSLDFFSQAHPNWQDAYHFASYFFIEERDNAIAILQRMR